MNRRVILWAAPLAWFGVPTLISACADDSSAVDDLSDVLYEGLATDEALVDMTSRTTQTDAAQGAVLTAPKDGVVLTEAAPVFSWAVGTNAERERPRRPSLDERVGGRGRPRLAALVSALGPGVARAHGAPLNGRAYLLVLSTPSAPKLVRVFTTNLSYAPAVDVWERVLNAAEPLTATVTNAVFETNRVAPDGGPYLGRPSHHDLG